jgi:hypothetical protein
VGRHLARLGEPDELTDTGEWTPAHAGRHPLPWRLVLGLGVPLGLAVSGVIWAANGSDPAADGSTVVVQASSAQPTEWLPEPNVGLGTGAPTPTAAPTPTPTASSTTEPTPATRTSAPNPPPPPPPPPPVVFSANYDLTSTSSDGFAASVVVTNESSRSGSWQVRLDYPSPDKVTVTDVSNASFSESGGELIFSGGQLGGGQAVTVRFEAEKNRPGETAPTKCTVNGVDCVGF